MGESSSGVTFVLEKLMMELINTTHDKIIPQALACNEEMGVIHEIKWIYKDMQVLRLFEEVVEKDDEIRDATVKVHDLLDLLCLNLNVLRTKTITGYGFHYFRERGNFADIAELAKRIHEGFTPFAEYIYSIECCREEVMQVLSEFTEIRDYNADEFFPSFMIYDEFCRLHSFLGKLSHVLVMGMSLTWPDFCVPGDYLLLSNMIRYMVDLAKRICHSSSSVSKEIRFFKTNVIPHYFHKPDLFTFLLRLSKKMIILAENISHGYEGVMEVTRPILRVIWQDSVQHTFDLSRLESLVIDNISHGFCSVRKDINRIRTEVMDIYLKQKPSFGVPQIGNSSHGAAVRAPNPQIGNSSHGAAVRAPKPLPQEEIMVGFDDEKTTIIEMLIGEHQKHLKVVPIVGMSGLGKTTLAKKVYNDPFIIDHFPTRAWTHVSQVYQKRDLLLAIFSSAFYFRDEISQLSNEELSEDLYKRLKGKRYLIVMDDIWNIGAWDDLKIYFPDDNNGSRIMFTTRLFNVATVLHAMPHCLRFLNENESWDLLRQRVFQRESCPPKLMKIGIQIAEKCQGLPLAIVVVAGILSKNVKTVKFWRQVATSVSSYIVSDREQYMDTLALSYNHLPHHLKSCFLYFGAFPENYEIPVHKLVWLWIAEGFIHEIGETSLENLAEDYLINLIDRNLVLVVRTKFTGEIKTCRVHDLLRDLCLKKAKEENFLQHIYWCEEILSSRCNATKQLFPSIAAKSDISSEFFSPRIRSYLYFGSEDSPVPFSFIERGFKLLRVLDFSTINVSTFSCLIVQLVFLRYLALRGEKLELPYNIAQLQNLETLVVSKGGFTYLPTDLWNIVKLRHLCIGGANDIGIVVQIKDTLNNLQTISRVCPSSECQYVLARTPNLQKLVFCGSFESKRRGFWFPDLDFLNQLKILKLLNTYIPGCYKYNLEGVRFPPNLVELTLSNTALAWEEMSIIGSLPNLESLKLKLKACVGPQWQTSDGGFCRLRFLRFNDMDIEQWNASSNHFPVLEHLALRRCQKLEEIPFEFGDIDTLQMIEVSCCSNSAINSAREIQKEQQDIGNDFLKIVIINPPDWELTL